jgi:hypothetical protein
MSYLSLDENSQQIIQPDALNIELMQHQKTVIKAMIDLEQKGYVDIKFRYFDNEEKELRLETSIGILGDRVGAGKTLDVISLILMQPTAIDRPIYFSSDRYITIREIGIRNIGINETNFLNCNVIMVPKGIQHQWEGVIKNNVKNDYIKYVSHYDRSTSDQLDRFDQIIDSCTDNSQIILCNELSINDIIKKYSDKKWNRFIIDEADTISFLSLDKIKASFVWLVSGTTNGIACSKKKYLKDIFGKNISWQPDFLTVKNNQEHINTSINLPKPNRITIKCHTPLEIMLLAEHIPKNIMNMINASNSDAAIKALNCHVDTSDNIYKVISNNYEMAIRNKQIELKAEKKKQYTSPDKNQEHQKRLKRLELVIAKLQSKLESMKKTLYDKANDSICPICMGDFEKPTLVDCCAHKYCFECLVIMLNKNHNKCPICQAVITKNKMHIMTDKSDDSDESLCDRDGDSDHDHDHDHANDDNKSDKKQEKITELCNIINSNKDGRFLVFADYDDTFAKIEKVLTYHNISYDILKGGGTKVRKIVENFHKGKTSVIMLNAKHFGAGMNLQCATDIIMYHRFTREMEEQIIGRGQRMGRQGTLNVYYLIHENENDSYCDTNFKDISYQEWIEGGENDDINKF